VANEYSEGAPWGFVDVRNQGDTITGTFVERFESEQNVTDPFGNLKIYKVINYSQARFNITTSFPHLELIEPPRSVAPLLTELSRAFGNNLVFSQIQLDVPQFINDFRHKVSSLFVTSATLDDVPLTNDIFARIHVNGSGEIRNHLKELNLAHKIEFQKVCVCGHTKTGQFRLELSSDARLQVQAGIADELIRLVRTCLNDRTKRHTLA
jgi:hypothetical protein